jgi:drug/metabolite transporter (DMT)-like permease
MKGAGGTSGGLGHFFIGLSMMCGGFYLLLNAISVTSNFAMSMRLYRFSAGAGSYGITSGMVMIPFIFGVGLVFYNSKNIVGWILTLGSITALIFGVITSIRFTLQSMTAFELIVILILAIGGLGLFLRSLKSLDARLPDQ